jgi:hypothetical protein
MYNLIIHLPTGWLLVIILYTGQWAMEISHLHLLTDSFAINKWGFPMDSPSVPVSFQVYVHVGMSNNGAYPKLQVLLGTW